MVVMLRNEPGANSAQCCECICRKEARRGNWLIQTPFEYFACLWRYERSAQQSAHGASGIVGHVQLLDNFPPVTSTMLPVMKLESLDASMT
jgi:hypothetical protein